MSQSRKQNQNIRGKTFTVKRSENSGSPRDFPKLVKAPDSQQRGTKASSKQYPKKIESFSVKDNTLYSLEYDSRTKTDVEMKVGRVIYIKEIRQDVETQSVELELEYYYKNKYHRKIISRKQLLKNELVKLLEYGLDVPDYKVTKVQKFLNLQEEQAPYHYTHSQLGWSEIEGVEVFKHDQSIGNDNLISSYNGSFNIKEKGTYETWKQIIYNDVVPHTPLCLALTAGFASPVVAWIAKDLDLEVLLLHAYGDSTTGKTTAARVYVSPFGAPTTKEGGCLLKWSGTHNGIIAQLVGNQGVPLAIDEASMNKMKDFTEILYVLAEGMEKARMTKELQLVDRRKWSGVLWSTAEHQLTEKANHNTGIKVRLTEIESLKWTESAAHANRLKESLLENYGQAGPIFIRHIQALGKAAILKRWKEWQVRCVDAMPTKDQFSHRIGDKLALLMTSAELVNECFDFDMDVDSILDLLINIEQTNAGERSVGDIAYRYFQEQVMQHQSKFEMNGRNEKAYECWGRIALKNGKNEVTILPSVFKAIMAEGNFEDTNVILRHWREKGYLDHDTSKLTRRRTAISEVEDFESIEKQKEVRANFYCIEIPDGLIDVKENEKFPHLLNNHMPLQKKSFL
ncbi:DUF927 domain-containing protein [Salipaludibacillus sp. CF4.18]|uniref:DUF927 domain-containing protein n=1 Tax=Salipaludibacillus sp. CF4.18 TaxID=3373081 RepID=UPI003EE431F9